VPPNLGVFFAKVMTVGKKKFLATVRQEFKKKNVGNHAFFRDN